MCESTWTGWADCNCQEACRQSHPTTYVYNSPSNGSPDMQAPAWATANLSSPRAVCQGSDHLSTEFKLLSTTGDWNAETLQGNPTWSPLVRRLTKGYKAEAEDQGYQQKGAVSLSGEEIQQLLEHLHAQQTKTSGSAKSAVHQERLGNQLTMAVHHQSLQCRQL